MNRLGDFSDTLFGDWLCIFIGGLSTSAIQGLLLLHGWYFLIWFLDWKYPSKILAIHFIQFVFID
jgi:hypothetical protein